MSRNVSIDSLLSCTIKNPQYRPSDFAKIGNFPYSNQIKPNNINLALFTYGSLKHLLYLNDGTLKPVSQGEFNSRIQHLINVFEIVGLGSGLADFDHYIWKVAREYDSKILQNIEHGLKNWETLDKTIDPTAWTMAKEIVPKAKVPSQSQPGKNSNNSNNGQQQKMCTTWNSFRQEGCHYESNNPGQSCVFLHFCSHCKSKGFNRKHKLWQCSDAAKAANVPPVSVAVPVTSV